MQKLVNFVSAPGEALVIGGYGNHGRETHAW